MNNLYVGREKDQSKKCILQNKRIILGEHKKNALKDISVCYQAFDENTFALMKNDIERKLVYIVSEELGNKCQIRYFRKISVK